MNNHQVTIQLEFTSTDASGLNVGSVNNYASTAFHDLQESGYDIHPLYTGERGGNIYAIATQIIQTIQDNKELLSTLISLAVPIIKHLLDKRAEQAKPQEQAPINIYLSIDNHTIIIPNNIPDHSLINEEVIKQHSQIDKKISLNSQVKILIQVPSQPTKKKR